MEIIIMKTIAIGCIILLSIVILFFSCNDKPNIQQAYDFSLSHWYLQEEIRKDESVEIRFTLHRSGNYQDAKYYIGYIQMAGKGEVYDQAGIRLVNRELHELDAIAGLNKSDPQEQVFTLFYKSLSTKSSEIKFVVVDNFKQTKEYSISFENDSEIDEKTSGK